MPLRMASRPHREPEGGRSRLGRALLRGGLGLSQKERARGLRVHVPASSFRILAARQEVVWPLGGEEPPNLLPVEP